MKNRRGRTFTDEQLEFIRNQVSKRRETNELSMLVFLILETNLKISEILGWFNTNRDKRCDYIQDRNDLLLEYESLPVLFTKTHHAYLLQWKKLIFKWFGESNATFEMLRRKQQLDSSTDKLEMNKISD